MKADVSPLPDVFETEEDGFDFGHPGRSTNSPFSARPNAVPAPPPMKIGGRPNALGRSSHTGHTGHVPRPIPTQKTFSTLFAAEKISVPNEPNVRVLAELHPLERARRVFGYSQKDLAKQSGVGLQTIRRYERGLSNPKLSTLRKLSASLNTPIDVISPN